MNSNRHSKGDKVLAPSAELNYACPACSGPAVIHEKRVTVTHRVGCRVAIMVARMKQRD